MREEAKGSSRRMGGAGKWVRAVVAGAAMLGWAAPGFGQVVLNELLADNESAVANGGEYLDYIELYNPGAAPVSLAGMSLTDDPDEPLKYVFPGEAVVPAQGYLVVWADDPAGGGGFYTGFGLSDSGETVRLYAADGVTVIDEVVFGLQAEDLSIGRVPDGSGAWVLNEPTPGEANAEAELGGLAGLRINEWMARPVDGEDWLEIYNTSSEPVNLSGVIITDSTDAPENRPVPALSFLGGHGYRQFFASDLEDEDADHLDFRLGGGGDTVRIYEPGAVVLIDEITYGEQQDGVSQGRAPDGSDTIVFFQAGRATPGEANVAPITSVVISEVLTHGDPPYEDAIELHNVTGEPVDISNWWLSDAAGTPRKFQIPAGTVIPAGGYVVFYQGQFGAGPGGFGLNSAEGDEVYLSAADALGNLTGEQTFAEFGAARAAVAIGRVETSAGVDFVPLSEPTFGVENPETVEEFRQGQGAPNAAPRVGPVVISEIMFQPPDGATSLDDEYVELHNPGAGPVLLYDPVFPQNTWRIRGGIDFDFPVGQSLAAGGFALVVSFDPEADPARLAAFRERHGVPAGVPVYGPYSGRLSNGGEEVELLLPDAPEGPDSSTPGLVPYVLVERVEYRPGAPWPSGAEGTGLSLQRVAMLEYGNEPMNWVVAEPTPGGDGGGGTGVELSISKAAEGMVRVSFPAEPSTTYLVQVTAAIASGDWATLTDVTSGPEGGTLEVDVPAIGEQRFFRLAIP